ncbi:MAG: HAMP domain-containing sensor histidine kinase [Cellulosilyticaceae bacterium]
MGENIKKRFEKEKKIKTTKIKKERFIKVKIIGAQLKNRGCALYATYKKKVLESIRLQILWMVFVAFILASIGGMFTNYMARNFNIGYYTHLDYREANQQLQNKLAQAVRQINELEYVNLNLRIDLQRLYDTIKEVQNDEIGIYNLAEQLDQMNSLEYEGNHISYNEAIESVKTSFQNISEEELIKLYQQLVGLIDENKWVQEEVEQVLEEFMSIQGLSESQDKRAAVEYILQRLDSSISYASDTKTFLIDSKGNIIYGDNFIRTIDLLEAIRKSATSSEALEEEQRTSLYPVIIDGEVYYVMNNTVLTGIEKGSYSNSSDVLSFLVGAIIFIYIILRGTKTKIKYVEYLGYCLGEISKGNLDFEVEKRGEDELARVASAMTKMEYELKEQMKERAQSEKTKSELITNVAHDLRTPLTSVIGYIGLVKEHKAASEEESAKYLEIAYNKAERLKILIEDLFEYTKLSNRSVKLKKETLSVATLVSQLTEELMPLAEDKTITISYHVAAKETNAQIDVLKMTRVFENLIENAIKYSDEGNRIQVIIQETKAYIYVTVRNRSHQIKEGDIEKLFDRFYRSDSSRNSTAGGSGLGLAIAKNIVDMHEGKIWAQLDQDMISFNVKLHKAVE